FLGLPGLGLTPARRREAGQLVEPGPDLHQEISVLHRPAEEHPEQVHPVGPPGGARPFGTDLLEADDAEIAGHGLVDEDRSEDQRGPLLLRLVGVDLLEGVDRIAQPETAGRRRRQQEESEETVLHSSAPSRPKGERSTMKEVIRSPVPGYQSTRAPTPQMKPPSRADNPPNGPCAPRPGSPVAPADAIISRIA